MPRRLRRPKPIFPTPAAEDHAPWRDPPGRPVPITPPAASEFVEAIPEPEPEIPEPVCVDTPVVRWWNVNVYLVDGGQYTFMLHTVFDVLEFKRSAIQALVEIPHQGSQLVQVQGSQIKQVEASPEQTPPGYWMLPDGTHVGRNDPKHKPTLIGGHRPGWW